MTSLSEDANFTDTLSEIANKSASNAWNKANVSRLEFHRMHPDGETSEPCSTKQPTFNALEVTMREQVEDMERQLILHQQQAVQQIEAAQREVIELRQKWEEELEVRIAIEREEVARICERFSEERARYFTEIESEVVRLALAIAARVLHREISLDPLLLTAAVKVVLEKIADNSAMELRVPVAEAERWQMVITAEAESRVQVIGDERMSSGDCILETIVGRVELGVKTQLEEIEKGFFDLLQRRPV